MKTRLDARKMSIAIVIAVMFITLSVTFLSPRTDLRGLATTSCTDLLTSFQQVNQVLSNLQSIRTLFGNAGNTGGGAMVQNVIDNLKSILNLIINALAGNSCIVPPRSCAIDSDCPTGQTCSGTAGNKICIAGTIGVCQTNANCGTNQVCSNNQCTAAITGCGIDADGDGDLVDGTEACDDGNLIDFDGCSPSCTLTCNVKRNQATPPSCDVNNNGATNEFDFDQIVQAQSQFVLSQATQFPSSCQAIFKTYDYTDTDTTIEDEDFFGLMQCVIDAQGSQGTSTQKATCTVPYPPLPSGATLPEEALCLGALSRSLDRSTGSPTILGRDRNNPVNNPFQYAPYLTARTGTKDFNNDGTADPALICEVKCDAPNVLDIQTCWNFNAPPYTITADNPCASSGGGTGITPGPGCGNGIIDSGETCDDGNAVDHDGCSSTCQVMQNWQCNGPAGTSLHCTTKLSLTRLATPEKTLILDSNKWLVFRSDAAQNPAINPLTSKPTNDITGNLIIADDRIQLFDGTPTTHQYEYWVTWVYNNPLSIGLQKITLKPENTLNNVAVYINGIHVNDIVTNPVSLGGGWSSIVIVMDTKNMQGTLKMSTVSTTVLGSTTITEALLGSNVGILTHYNFDYDNDGKLSQNEDWSAYTGTTCQHEVLWCILDTDAIDPIGMTENPFDLASCTTSCP